MAGEVIPNDPLPPTPASYIEYYIQYRDDNGTTIAAHPNGIALVFLQTPHPAIELLASSHGADAVLSFDVDAGNLLKMPLRKGRGPMIDVGRPLCVLASSATLGHQAEPETGVIIQSPIQGRFVEVNARLQHLRQLELSRALQEEYLVILELNSSQLEALRIKVAADQQEANYDVQYVN